MRARFRRCSRAAWTPRQILIPIPGVPRLSLSIHAQPVSLTVRKLRKRTVNEPDVARKLPLRQSVSAPLDHFVLGDGRTVTHQDGGINLLCADRIRHTADDALLDRWMLHDRELELFAGDVLAGALDDVLDAPVEIDKTFLVNGSHIARVQPAIAQSSRGILRIAIVALEHVGMSDT